MQPCKHSWVWHSDNSSFLGFCCTWTGSFKYSFIFKLSYFFSPCPVISLNFIKFQSLVHSLKVFWKDNSHLARGRGGCYLTWLLSPSRLTHLSPPVHLCPITSHLKLAFSTATWSCLPWDGTELFLESLPSVLGMIPDGIFWVNALGSVIVPDWLRLAEGPSPSWVTGPFFY